MSKEREKRKAEQREDRSIPPTPPPKRRKKAAGLEKTLSDRETESDEEPQQDIENASLVTVPYKIGKSKPPIPWPAIAFKSWSKMKEYGIACDKYFPRPVKEKQVVICYCGPYLSFGVVKVEQILFFDPAQTIPSSVINSLSRALREEFLYALSEAREMYEGGNSDGERRCQSCPCQFHAKLMSAPRVQTKST